MGEAKHNRLAPPTFGVEEELLLVDPETGVPVPINRDVAAAATKRGVELQLELSSCEVELTSSVATSSAALREELLSMRRVAAESAASCGALLIATALPPVTPTDFPVTETERYQKIADKFGMLAHEQGICGLHVHVGVEGRETAIQVGNWLRPWLPTFLALTANSAIYRGTNTGYSSWRSILWRRWPSAGPPPYFNSAAEFDALTEMMRSSGAILDRGMIYWDVRPSANFPTVEVRVSDVPGTVEESVLLATLIRAAVMTATEDLERGATSIRVPDEVLNAAYWKAARDGLAGEGIDVFEQCARPAIKCLGLLLDIVRPALERLGDLEWVTEEIAQLIAHGNGAIRQRHVYAKRHEALDVVKAFAASPLNW